MWRLQRKDPGWVVGEHMQVFRGGADEQIGLRFPAMKSDGDPTSLKNSEEVEQDEGEAKAAGEEFRRKLPAL